MELRTKVEIDGVNYTVNAYTEWYVFLNETEPRMRLHITGVYHFGGAQVTRDSTYREIKVIQRALFKEYGEQLK